MEKLRFRCDKIDESLIKKLVSLGNEEEWIVMVYKQFNFQTYEEIRAFALKYKKFEWMSLFYWSNEVEADCLKVLLKFYPGLRKRNQVIAYYKQASLNWFPTNNEESWKRHHNEVKKALGKEDETKW